jgi:hypothetical protein
VLEYVFVDRESPPERGADAGAATGVEGEGEGGEVATESAES